MNEWTQSALFVFYMVFGIWFLPKALGTKVSSYIDLLFVIQMNLKSQITLLSAIVWMTHRFGLHHAASFSYISILQYIWEEYKRIIHVIIWYYQYKSTHHSHNMYFDIYDSTTMFRYKCEPVFSPGLWGTTRNCFMGNKNVGSRTWWNMFNFANFFQTKYLHIHFV